MSTFLVADTCTGQWSFWHRLNLKVMSMLKVSSRFGSLLLVFLTGLIVLGLAVPSNAAAADDDKWVVKKIPAEARWKYGYEYGKMMGKTYVSKNVDPKIAPGINKAAKEALDARKNRAPVIDPGKTKVLAPILKGNPLIVFAPVEKPLFGRILGMGAIGIGGNAEIPSNAVELYRGGGVTEGCITSISDQSYTGCSATEIKTAVGINACSLYAAHQTQSCEKIGAKTEDNQWEWPVIPMLDELWAKLTGQTNDGLTNPDGTPVITNPRGCFYKIHFTGNPASGEVKNGTFTVERTLVAPRPESGTSQSVYWDQSCAQPLLIQHVKDWRITTTCIDAFGRTANPATGGSYGAQVNTVDWNYETHKFNVPLCSDPNAVIMSLRIGSTITQATLDATAATWSGIQYTEWVNPATTLDFVEGTEFHTTTNCVAKDGQRFSYTQKTHATAATIAPQCPVGTKYDSHATKTHLPGAGSKTTTIDENSVDPTKAANHPGCEVEGCVLDVVVDGKVCAVGVAECASWPTIQFNNPSRVACHYGGKPTHIDSCRVLSDAYVNGSTGLVYDPHSGNWVSIDSAGAPLAANPAPWNPTNPNPVPGVKSPTVTTTAPTTGTGTGTSTGGFPASGSASENDACGGAWKWNPFDWVGKQLQCAFVPKTDIKTRIKTVEATLAGTAPVSWIMPGALAGPGSSGCPNWTVTVGGFTDNVVCDKPFTNAILGARGPMLVLVQTAMVWPLIRSLWYASIPFLRATPTGGK